MIHVIVYARVYLFVNYSTTMYNTYIVQDESANKLIKNYDNAKCEIKSHTSSYANMQGNMLPSEKLISGSK